MVILQKAMKRDQNSKVLRKRAVAGKALHTYRLEDSGLTKELVRSAFKEYVEKFNLWSIDFVAA